MALLDGPGALDTSPHIGAHPFSGRVEDLLAILLTKYPAALVAAIPGDTPTGLTALPDRFPLAESYRRIPAGSLVELVSMSDRPIISRLWWQARTTGTASAVVRSIGGGKATLSIFDLRGRYGVLIVVVVEAVEHEAEAVTTGVRDQLPTPTRYARIVKDGTALILDVDPAFERMLGFHRDELIGHRTVEFIHPDDHELAVDNWIQMFDFSGPSRPVRLRHRNRDGRWIWLEVTNHNRLDDPEFSDVVADMVDISDEISALEALRARQQLLEQVTEAVPLGLFHADIDGRLLYANFRLTEITGLGAGCLLGDWPGLATSHHRMALDAALAGAGRGNPSDLLVEMVDARGEIRHCAVGLRPLADGTGAVNGVTGSVEDVTNDVVERRELEVRAATDALTSCLNRSASLAVIQDALDTVGSDRERRGGVAVLFIDVDGMKDVNDDLGHSAGDALLVEVASRLRAAVRTPDSVGRVGGDEFVAVAGHVLNREHAMSVASWVASRVTQEFEIDGRPIGVRASVGVAWTDSPGVQAAWLVRQADRAMYESKRQGRCEAVMAS
ncbi:MAG TPA: sensor domain-containing diguanylate cyclase [Acidimicrobiales bacterium]|jgi:diguanylate cyclase (GGDEF)-like protein/PAS domain S-box-containing protein|nr:sensor domain-containing diguanylate cyclase [Acidimicrobiales bacterium]